MPPGQRGGRFLVVFGGTGFRGEDIELVFADATKRNATVDLVGVVPSGKWTAYSAAAPALMWVDMTGEIERMAAAELAAVTRSAPRSLSVRSKVLRCDRRHSALRELDQGSYDEVVCLSGPIAAWLDGPGASRVVRDLGRRLVPRRARIGEWLWGRGV